MTPRRWCFVRHGESVANAEGWLAGGDVDAPLTARGRAQAEALAHLREAGFRHVVSSDLARAADTARLALGGEPHHLVRGLRERRLGAWERCRKADLVADGRWAVLHAWADGPPGGECHRDVASRMATALAALDEQLGEGDVIVFSHGTALRCALGVLDGVAYGDIGKSLLGNAEHAVREIPRGAWAALHARLDRVD